MIEHGTFGESGKPSDRFVCPSDRQLALRAKLKTGWSIKTGSLGQMSPPVPEPLTNEETQTIISVVQRAELEEQREAERVGRLVDRVESMRRMALGKDPNECLLCGETFGLLTGGPKLFCADCKKIVCQKCGTEMTVKNKRPVWLCKICHETREMWKKSGAWFFRGLPRYVLPPTSKLKSKVNRFTQITQIGRKELPLRKDASSGSDDERRSFTRSPNYRDESLGDLFSRQTSSNESQKSMSSGTGTFICGGSGSEDCHSQVVDFKVGVGGVSPSNESIYSQNNNAYGSNCLIMDYSPKCTDPGDDKTSLASVVSGANTFQGIPEEYMNRCPYNTMGSVEVTLHYDAYSNMLHCTIHRARSLTSTDINGLADPFCKINILPTNNPSTRLRTKTVHKTRNPEFNETLTYYGVTPDDIERKALHILVLDDDRYGYDFMGEAKITLEKLKQQGSLKVTSTLCGPTIVTGDVNIDSQYLSTLWGDVPNTRGQILLALTFNTKKRALVVGVMRCVHLPPMDSNGFSDPFVKLYLSPSSHHKKHKTAIKWKNLNPVFNEEFVFETRLDELSSKSLRLTVWDKDYGKSNDYLGGLILGSMSKGKRLKNWLDMIKFPDRRHEAWHYLTEDMVTE